MLVVLGWLLAGEPELCWLCWLCCKFSAHQASVTLAGSVPSGIDWKTSAAMRWSIDPSMHLLVARNATITCDEVELAVLQPASDGDLWCDTSQASRGKKCLVGVVTSWQRALLGHSVGGRNLGI